MKMKSKLILFDIILLIFLFCIFNTIISQNICVNKEKCGDCIRTKNCTWCMKENFQNQPRCVHISSDLYSSCTETFIVNPKNEDTVKKSEELTRTLFKDNDVNETIKIVQLTPQVVSLKLRVNEVYELKFQYAQAEDHPMDLYYLMDLSNSMAKYKDDLSNLGSELAKEMKKITRNFRLGFGSFVDKVLMPFTLTNEKHLQDPCGNGLCAEPYSYIHHMNLTTDSDQFAKEVNNAKVSSNLDAPEGGFDAIMQAIVCGEKIGWRDGARRLLVFSTDAEFHYAGDGKLAGIIEPNDGQCHMENNRYTHAEILDYPSVSHLNHVVKENSVNIIFAVTQNVKDAYSKLTKSIEGSSHGLIDDVNSNVVELIKNEYSKITSEVEMNDNATPPVKIKYFTSCLDEQEIEQKKCSGLKDDNVINFRAEIVVTECPKNEKDWKQTIEIYPIGIGEKITINLEILCSCDCEKPNNPLYETNSDKCNQHGTYKCGICECDKKYFGRKCECSSNMNIENSSKGCRPDNTTKIDCHGRGTCICGVCECKERNNPKEIISGPFCECDNFSCQLEGNLLCSGEDHGRCECGKCNCNSEWEGPACECKVTKDSCVNHQSPEKEICSGHGECKCGTCECHNRYTGNYCQQYLTSEKRCKEFESCVECHVHKSGSLKEECIKNCTLFTPIIVDKIETMNNNSDIDIEWKKCKAFNVALCEFVFEYKEFPEENGKVEVRAEKEIKCPPQASAVKTAFYVIIPIISLGLLFLFSWKVVTTVHDRREYSKFEKEKLMAKWDTLDNPIYKEATAMYRNPGFNN